MIGKIACGVFLGICGHSLLGFVVYDLYKFIVLGI